MFIGMFENKINWKTENPYANVLHLSFFHFFWISIDHCALSFFLFQDILFASLSGWFLFFWSQTFLFLCNLVNMIFCFSMFYYPYCCLIFILYVDFVKNFLNVWKYVSLNPCLNSWYTITFIYSCLLSLIFTNIFLLYWIFCMFENKYVWKNESLKVRISFSGVS